MAGGLTGLVGALAYSSLLLQWTVDSDLSVLHSYVSELSVRSEPSSALFRTFDVIAGAGLLVLAVMLARRLPAGRRRTTGCVALAVTAVASALDGLQPMSCAPSSDPVCRAGDSGALAAQLREPHTLSSLAEFAAAIIAMVVLSSLFQRLPGWRRLGRWDSVAGLMVGGLGVLEVCLVLADLRWVGLPERGQVLVVSLWCGAVAVRLIAGGGAPAAAREVSGGPPPPGPSRTPQEQPASPPTPDYPRSSAFITFPLALRGSSVRKATSRGTL
ncbi:MULTISPECIES: DUF998 domain-containing protein [unclassified Streptomyces]|uniref:DUF998 domain-containing protein n=1 Tax=unclassified Streptomyces TaxID=2593676 RepID=UPI0024BBE229|nr:MULTISPECIES: DUF998 domain-containing protein [unclassified Streptomyces]MDJ0342419.1 DUF998 domain-containing protein [Streptomyces sp. PH10-H1]